MNTMKSMSKYLSCILPSLVCFSMLLISGCLVAPVAKSGGIGSVTVTNSNPNAIIAAAQSVFPNYGYTPGVTHYPTSVSFDKSSSKFATVMWGGYYNPQSVHVKIQIVRIPGTNDYRISPKVFSVSNAGQAGFESKRPLIGLWNSEFSPLLGQIASQASGAGGF